MSLFKSITKFSILSLIVLFGFISIVGKSNPPSPPTGTTPAQLPPELACVVGKTVKITGKYYTPFGMEVNISRDVDVTATFFKVSTEATDDLSNHNAVENAKVDTWVADYFDMTDAESQWYGFQNETEAPCKNVNFKKGPFEGPLGKQCTMTATAKVCPDLDPCVQPTPSWQIKCDVDANGKGGTAVAFGSWSVAEPE